MPVIDGSNKFFSDIMGTVDFIAEDARRNNEMAQQVQINNALFDRQKNIKATERKFKILDSIRSGKQFAPEAQGAAMQKMIDIAGDPNADIGEIDFSFKDPTKLLPGAQKMFGAGDYGEKMINSLNDDYLLRSRPKKTGKTSKSEGLRKIMTDSGDELGTFNNIQNYIKDAKQRSLQMLSKTQRKPGVGGKFKITSEGNEDAIADHINKLNQIEYKAVNGQPLTAEDVQVLQSPVYDPNPPQAETPQAAFPQPAIGNPWEIAKLEEDASTALDQYIEMAGGDEELGQKIFMETDIGKRYMEHLQSGMMR